MYTKLENYNYSERQTYFDMESQSPKLSSDPAPNKSSFSFPLFLLT